MEAMPLKSPCTDCDSLIFKSLKPLSVRESGSTEVHEAYAVVGEANWAVGSLSVF